MEAVMRDIRQAVKVLMRMPGVTAAAIVALALGIGANTAIFSVVYAVLLKPLPVAGVDRLATVAVDSRKLNVTGAQPGFRVYARLVQGGKWFESMAAAAPGTAAVGAEGAEVNERVWRTTSSFLPVLGVTPGMGRSFAASEDQPGAARVALISHSYWRAHFNASPSALGATLRIENEPHTVIGVLPSGFHVDGRPAAIYVPLARSLNSKETIMVNIYARLKPGVTLAQAQAEVEAMSKHAEPSPLGWEPRLWNLREFQVRDVRLSLWVLLGAVGLVLLIACANTATLLLARSNARRREMAIRAAMGAGRGRLMRQMLTESVILALMGGACGVAVAALGVRLIPLVQHERLPGLLEQTAVDWAVLGFTFLISVLAGLVFGAAPALLSQRVDVHETLKEGGRAGSGGGRRRGWNALIISETALAVVLAVGATLLIKTFFYLRDAAPGFNVDRLVTARITPPPRKFSTREQYIAYWRTMIEKVRAIPGVEAASFAQLIPLTGDNQILKWPVEGHNYPRPEEYPVLYLRNVETGYFRTMQMSLRRGRLFEERDNADAAKVVVVNESLARRFWPGQDPIGKHIGGQGEPAFEIIGVVSDVRSEDATKAAPAEVFFHFLQIPPGRIALAIRANASVYRNPLQVEPALRQAIAGVDPGQPVTHFAEMRQVLSDRIAPKRLSAGLISVFAGLALLLASVGIYGVLSFSVAQRTHEIGVRTALGADRRQVLLMVLREAASVAVAGAVIGAAGALAFTHVAKSLLYGVGATEPSVYLGTGVLMVVVALAAAFAPARRAATVDPLVALRDE